MNNFKEDYSFWLNNNYFDENTKKELENIKNDENEIKERFYKNLEFGTGGLRGIIGAGTNRINIYTISKATQGFADYLLNKTNYSPEKGVAIGYDSRFMSPEFAEITALVLNGNNIKTYIFDELKPTPMLSFAVRELNCCGGIVITASHNPPEYNGYKVYGEDGGQVPPPEDEKIIQYVNNITDFNQIKKASKEDAVKTGLFNIIEKEVDESFYKNVLKQSLNKDSIEKSNLNIVYTPIHGTGNKPVRKVLEKAGFKNVFIVKEQENPDSNFSTVGYPNPEDPKVFKLALKLANEVNADVIIGTDPDADRVGVIVKNAAGEYNVLSGNTVGILLTKYILSQLKEKGELYPNDTVISTVVSSNMTQKIAKSYNINYINVLTGFKFFGEKIKEFEKTNSNKFILGFEESYGYLIGTHARDKDAIVTTMLICEMVAFYKSKGLTLIDQLEEIYKKYGYFKDDIHSITLKGLDGIENINKIMHSLRNEPPKEINSIKIVALRDYKTSECLNTVTGEKTLINIQKSNVLYFELEDKSWFCIRPSGTEPKLKIYFGVEEDTQKLANEKSVLLKENVINIIDNILN